jgi:hypothetical protein
VGGALVRRIVQLHAVVTQKVGPVARPCPTGDDAAAMAKAEEWVRAGSDRCFALPHRQEDARASCIAKGCCKVGWVVSRGGRESHDVWLEVATGLVKLLRRVQA